MYCEYCGNKLKDGDKFCCSCGAAVNPVPINIEPEYECSDKLIKLLSLSTRLDYVVGTCSIITSLIFVFITLSMILLGIVTFWVIFLSIFAFLGAALSGAIVFALWTMAMTHIRSGKRIKAIINKKEKFGEDDRKVMKKAMIIEIISIVVGWFTSYGILSNEVTNFLSGDSKDVLSFGFAIFLIVFFIAVVANQIIKFIAYRQMQSEKVI